MISLERVMLISFALALTTITSQNGEKCEYPVELRNTLVVLNPRTEMNFSCNQTLSSLASVPVKHCVNDKGNWTYCLDDYKKWMKCGYPGHPSNGYIYFGRTMGNELAYTCNNGFHLLGEKVRSCQPNGTWSSHIPKCVKYFDIKLAEKRLTDRNRFTCETLNESRKQFDFKQKTKFHNIQIVFMNKNDENEVKIYLSNDDRNLTMVHGPVTLSTGFEPIGFRPLPGANEARYLVISTTKLISICEIFSFDSNEETSCGKPDEPLHGRIKRMTSIFVEFECERGYSLQGEKSAFCVKGVWQYPSPECRHPSINAAILASTAKTPFIEGTQGIATSKRRETTKTSQNKEDNTPKNNEKFVIIAWVVGGCAVIIVAMCLTWRYRVNRKQLFNERSITENEQREVSSYAEVKDVPSYAEAKDVPSYAEVKDDPVYENVRTVPVNEVIYAEVYATGHANVASCSKERVSVTEYSYATTSFIEHVVRSKAAL